MRVSRLRLAWAVLRGDAVMIGVTIEASGNRFDIGRAKGRNHLWVINNYLGADTEPTYEGVPIAEIDLTSVHVADSEER